MNFEKGEYYFFRVKNQEEIDKVKSFLSMKYGGCPYTVNFIASRPYVYFQLYSTGEGIRDFSRIGEDFIFRNFPKGELGKSPVNKIYNLIDIKDLIKEYKEFEIGKTKILKDGEIVFIGHGLNVVKINLKLLKEIYDGI